MALSGAVPGASFHLRARAVLGEQESATHSSTGKLMVSSNDDPDLPRVFDGLR
ncbi:hypothetical protein B0G57_12375 [Trinickia symbiotica]|nr:hypothetical protein B0G57_12375 [Trinickia symbiotica]